MLHLRIDVEDSPFTFQLGDAFGPFQRIGFKRALGEEILSIKYKGHFIFKLAIFFFIFITTAVYDTAR